ncbi:Sensory neuron membrane protein 1 [Frankliniella fusca]|uniref:Sensory neuron membrane protein 1 n=1 Tax=Frankliniella fusca TaxID=407009 RepID=A0AAE1H823_9NEOP|nr:Sensory neuron membrane protein 1 [Frankliniella fusca]
MSNQASAARAVVYWQKENKVGIEPLKHVVESGRFENAVTTAKFTGDRKYYPVKVLMISANDEELDGKVSEVERQIEDAAKSKDLPKRRRRAHVRSASQASDQDVARAVGGKVPVPIQLLSESQDIQKENKTAKLSKTSGQKLLDSNILCQVRRSLNPAFQNSLCKPQGGEVSGGNCDVAVVQTEEKRQSLCDDESSVDEHSDDDEDLQVRSAGPSTSNSNTDLSGFLSKYSNSMFTEFLRDLLALMEAKSEEEIKLLTLLPIKPEAKPVALTSSYDVKIPMAVKDQLKVDFYNKPNALARETLFALYGKEAFRTLRVNGRGTKKGTYGVHDDVLKAICCFVNRHINKAETDEYKVTQFVKMINKRSSDWQKGTPASVKKSGAKKLKTSAADGPDFTLPPSESDATAKELSSPPVRPSSPSVQPSSPPVQPSRTPLSSLAFNGSSPSPGPSSHIFHPTAAFSQPPNPGPSNVGPSPGGHVFSSFPHNHHMYWNSNKLTITIAEKIVQTN